MDCHGVPLDHLVFLSQPHCEGKHNQSSTKSFLYRIKDVGGACLLIDKFIPLCFIWHGRQIKPGHTIKLEHLTDNKDLLLFMRECYKYFMVHTCILKNITY